MGKKKGLLTFLLCMTMLLTGIGLEEALQYYTGETIGEHIVDVADKVIDFTKEKTGMLTEATCKIVEDRQEQFYLATQERYAGLMEANSQVTYTPLYIKVAANNKIEIGYRSSVKIGDETFSDVLTATLTVNSDAETLKIVNDIEAALRQGNEKEASRLIGELVKKSSISVAHSTGTDKNNENLSNLIIENVTAEGITQQGVSEGVAQAILKKLGVKDFVVTNFSITADVKSQSTGGMKDVENNETGEIESFYKNVVAKNVKIDATFSICVNDTVYLFTVSQGNISVQLGEHRAKPNGLSKEELEALINEKFKGLSGEELAAALADLVIGENGLSFSLVTPDKGIKINPTKSIVVGRTFSSFYTEVITYGDTTYVMEYPQEEKEVTEEDQKEFDEKTQKAAAAAKMQVARKQAARREQVNYQKAQQYNRNRLR